MDKITAYETIKCCNSNECPCEGEIEMPIDDDSIVDQITDRMHQTSLELNRDYREQFWAEDEGLKQMRDELNIDSSVDDSLILECLLGWF